MKQSFKAIYENGVYRPLAPVDLPEGTVVSLWVEPLSDEGSGDASEQDTDLSDRFQEGRVYWCTVEPKT